MTIIRTKKRGDKTNNINTTVTIASLKMVKQTLANNGTNKAVKHVQLVNGYEVLKACW
jgi:hypothetical protein